ncbi:hypothetical protein [Maribacter litoralis]|uniref:hypothetical protein n=1 Tax=Maribacter litoralis TaxID=2059726 RepID=UPI003F5CC5C1
MSSAFGKSDGFPVTRLAKAFGFDLFFVLFKAKSNRFSEIINITKPFYKTPSHALVIGNVSGIKQRMPNPVDKPNGQYP